MRWKRGRRSSNIEDRRGARPRTGLPNLRLVGDSIFPGQSTAGVTLGAMRVADDVQRCLPRIDTRTVSMAQEEFLR